MSKVIFKKSQVEVEWTDEEASILELAEANDLDLDYGCRMEIVQHANTALYRVRSSTRWGILVNLIPTMLSCVVVFRQGGMMSSLRHRA